MRFEALPIEGAVLVRTEPREDHRGRFVRVWCEETFAALRPGLRWVQSNLSLTRRRGTVRGLHLQRAPAAETKLVRAIAGTVFDVIVDLRADSPTFLRWHGVTLAADQQTELLIPPGVAHGFQALDDDSQLLYFHSCAYSPEHETGVRHDDPRLGIRWPLPPTGLSARDAALPSLTADFSGVPA